MLPLLFEERERATEQHSGVHANRVVLRNMAYLRLLTTWT
jgi:hypothetical protein